jgi:hypothetical protein
MKKEIKRVTINDIIDSEAEKLLKYFTPEEIIIVKEKAQKVMETEGLKRFDFTKPPIPYFAVIARSVMIQYIHNKRDKEFAF